MDISPTCEPPRQPLVTEQEKNDPVYRAYDNYVSACRRQLVTANNFQSWKEYYERTTTHHVYQHCTTKLWGWHILSKPYGSTDAPKELAGERAIYKTEDGANSALEKSSFYAP